MALSSTIATVLQQHEEQIALVEENWPKERSIRLDWATIAEKDEGYADDWLTKPDQSQEQTRKVLSDNYDVPTATRVRVWNLPEKRHVRIGKSRTRHLGQLYSLQGEVVDINGVKPFATEVAWACGRCGTITRIPGNFGRLQKPGECMGCERSKNQAGFRFHQDQSEMIDQQKVVVVPADSALEEPPAMTVYLRRDLCDTIGPGDIVAVVGEYKTFPYQDENPLSTYIKAYDLDEAKRSVTDSRSSEELDSLIKQVANELQQQGKSFEAHVDEVVETLTEKGIRQQEAEDRLDALEESGDINVNGDTLMVL